LPYTDKVWETPPYDLLEDDTGAPPDFGNIREREKIIKDTLKSFNINVGIEDVQPGPAVTQYALSVDSGTKISKIVNLQYEIASALKSPTGSVRMEAPIPGTDRIGIEVPNKNRAVVNFKSLLMSDAMRNTKSRLSTVLGKDVSGNTIVYDIAKMPHMLIAGATGSGKSVFLHSLIFSLLYRTTPQECKLVLIDTKRTELVNYGDIPHLMTPVVTEIEKAAAVFRWAAAEMDHRYKLFEAAKARNIDSYNEKSGFQAMPYIVVVVDELADIMIADPTSVEKNIIRIAQLARAAGIHLVLSVQRPSAEVITGLIKANIPCRVAFNVASQVDSRVIIDQPGAEKLLGKGDMLFMPPDAAKPMRLQGAWVSDREITNLVNYLKARGVQPEYREDITSVPTNSQERSSTSSGGGDVDTLFDEAVEIVTSAGKASASLLQRRLTIGYARAARILDELEERGVVGPQQGSKPRDVLTRRETVDDFLGPDPGDEEF
jgi:S-DNA-T family DNA segregation ATPase FtsK/SpoIIIE